MFTDVSTVVNVPTNVKNALHHLPRKATFPDTAELTVVTAHIIVMNVVQHLQFAIVCWNTGAPTPRKSLIPVPSAMQAFLTSTLSNFTKENTQVNVLINVRCAVLNSLIKHTSKFTSAATLVSGHINVTYVQPAIPGSRCSSSTNVSIQVKGHLNALNARLLLLRIIIFVITFVYTQEKSLSDVKYATSHFHSELH